MVFFQHYFVYSLCVFGTLPEKVRNELFVKLVENEAAAYGVANTVANNFGLPEKVRNELLVSRYRNIRM